MDLKRILTTVIGAPVVLAILFLGNTYIIDIVLGILAGISMYEFFSVIKKVSHPLKWIGYLSIIIIPLAANPWVAENITKILVFSIPTILLISFAKVIVTDMKTTFKDVAYTFLGISYVTWFILFLALLVGMENGKILLGYCLAIAWSTDIFAYIVGKRWGKHKFSKVSPKKSIEGCAGGTLAAVIFGVLYVFLVSKFLSFEVAYLNQVWLLVSTGIASLIFSLIGQLGDFVASSIKRFADTKDYGSILPGHGGILDRIDSLIFIAPFVYMVMSLIS